METGLIPPALIILSAAVSGYFSLMETALIESHRGRLEKLSEDGDTDAAAVLKMLEAPAPLSVAQIGITFTGILAGVCAILTSPTIAGLINLSIIPAVVIAVGITTFIFLLFGEFLPKQAAKRDPENILLNHYKTFRLIVALMNPFVSLLTAIAGGVGFIFGMNSSKSDAVTEDEVVDLIEQGT